MNATYEWRVIFTVKCHIVIWMCCSYFVSRSFNLFAMTVLPGLTPACVCVCVCAGPSLIAAGGTLVPSNGLQMVSGGQNGAVMQLVSSAPAPTQLATAPARAHGKHAKQPQLLPKTLAPSLPQLAAKQTLMAQPPMVLAASGGLGGGGGGGTMVVTPVMVQSAGGGHHIQYILREQPNFQLSFPAVSAAGKAGAASAVSGAPHQAVLLPTAGGGHQTVLLQPSQHHLLQPAIRLLAPQIQQIQTPNGPALFALAPQQQAAMLGPQHLGLPQQFLAQQPQPQPQQAELRTQQQHQQQQQQHVTVQAAPRRAPANKKKRRDEPPAAGQPAKKAFVDLEDIMKKSGIFGDMDDEPGLHTEPVKPEPPPAPPAPPAEQPPLSIVQPLQVSGVASPPAPRLASSVTS